MESISFSSWIQLTTQQHCGVRTHEKFGDFISFLFAGQPKKTEEEKSVWRYGGDGRARVYPND